MQNAKKTTHYSHVWCLNARFHNESHKVKLSKFCGIQTRYKDIQMKEVSSVLNVDFYRGSDIYRIWQEQNRQSAHIIERYLKKQSFLIWIVI